MHFFNGLLFSFVLATQVVAFGQGPSCRGLFRESPIGYFVNLEEGSTAFVNTDPESKEAFQKQVGHVDYRYYSVTRSLLIEWINVEPFFRENGIANHLLDEVLQTYPDAQQITGYLTDFNYERYQKSVRDGKTPDEALRDTPIYHSLSRQGFSDIFVNTEYDGKVVMVLRKSEGWPNLVKSKQDEK